MRQLIPVKPLAQVASALAEQYPDRMLLAIAVVDTYLAVALFDLSTEDHEKFATWVVNFSEKPYTVDGHYFESLPHELAKAKVWDYLLHETAWKDYITRTQAIGNHERIHRLVSAE